MINGSKLNKKVVKSEANKTKIKRFLYGIK